MWEFWWMLAGAFGVVGGVGAMGLFFLVPLSFMRPQSGDRWKMLICAVACGGFVVMALILDAIGVRT